LAPSPRRGRCIGFVIGLERAFNHQNDESARNTAKVAAELSDPLSFSVAICFALIYAAVGWLMHRATEQFGAAGGYVAAVISGATDVDAVTLSTARAAAGSVSEQALVTILLAALSNTRVKCIITLVVGSAELRRHVLPGVATLFLATGLLISGLPW